MAKVEIEIPDEAVSAEVRVKFAELERKLKNAENRERRLKDKVAILEADREFILKAKNEMEELVDSWVDDLGLWGNYDRA